MNRKLAAGLAGLIAAVSLSAFAQADAPKHTKKAAAKTHTAKPATTPAAVAEPETLTQGQLDAANRVFVGHADCEFKQGVDVSPVDGQPGHFNVSYKNQTFHMVPEETTTGAVRLHDRKADVVWLQIPVKSMLMNNKVGQRMVDSCQHAEQRTTSQAPAAGTTALLTAQ